MTIGETTKRMTFTTKWEKLPIVIWQPNGILINPPVLLGSHEPRHAFARMRKHQQAPGMRARAGFSGNADPEDGDVVHG